MLPDVLCDGVLGADRQDLLCGGMDRLRRSVRRFQYQHRHEEALCATGAASRADDAGRCAEGLARIPEDAGSRALLTTRARRAIAFSSEVESGSREENASNQNPRAFHRFKVKGSSTPSRTMHVPAR